MRDNILPSEEILKTLDVDVSCATPRIADVPRDDLESRVAQWERPGEHSDQHEDLMVFEDEECLVTRYAYSMVIAIRCWENLAMERMVQRTGSKSLIRHVKSTALSDCYSLMVISCAIYSSLSPERLF